ncbi:MAG: type II secretion system F family protein [Nocardioides sp.]
MRRVALLLVAALLGLLPTAAWGSGTSGAAGEAAAISYVEPTDDGRVQLVVSLPPSADPDLDSVAVSVGGTDVEATAEPAGTSGAVQRTAVLVMDTSNSMEGERFAAAQSAALAYVDGLPADVSLGIVTFAREVAQPLAPTTDRDAARAVIGELSLSGQTALYDGVLSAVDMAGTEGQRTLVVLSDGADTTETTLESVTAAVSTAEVTLDVVSLEQSPGGDLTTLAEAGGGEVIPATSEALSGTFAAEADALTRQVLVTAELPADLQSVEQQVAVTLTTSTGDLRAEAFATVASSIAGGSGVDDQLVRSSGWALPSWAMYAGIALLGVGLVVLLVLLVPTPAPAPTAADRVASYTAKAGGATEPEGPRIDTDQAIAQAKDAAANVLKRNKGLEAKIAARLDGAGSELKPAEWLLVHTGVVVVAGVLGLLLGAGNILLGLLFIGLGVVGPWVYLGIRQSRRRKAFNAGLPDTLQLISGSLSAGLSLAQSVDTVVREGPEPISTEFRRVLVETRLGVTIEDALEGLAERFESKDFEWVVMAIRIQRQVGGNLAELLDTVAGTMREREYVRRQVAALSAEGRLSAWVLGLLPPLFMVYLLLTNYDYVGVMFTDPRGWVMLAGAALWLGAGVFWMSRLVKVEM